MGGSSPAQTTQTTQVKLPDWVNKASEGNYQLAQQIAAKPLEQYAGDTVADWTPDSKAAFDMLRGSVGMGASAYDEAAGLASKSAGGILSLDRDKYMNPYIDNVETKALSALDDSRVKSLMSNADKAAAAKAFGGSRSGVVDAVTNSETAKSAGLLSAQLRADAYDKATGAMQGDLDNFSRGATQVAATADGRQNQMLKDFTALLGSGQAQQGQNQAEIDADVAKFMEARDYDLQGLNLLLASLGMSPYGNTTSSTGTKESGSSGMNVGSIISGGLGLIGSLGMSDKTTKTDIEKVGKDPETGLMMYAYRYKSDPKTYPKVVGPMAQDIEKSVPHMVRKIGGKIAVKGLR